MKLKVGFSLLYCVPLEAPLIDPVTDQNLIMYEYIFRN